MVDRQGPTPQWLLRIAAVGVHIEVDGEGPMPDWLLTIIENAVRDILREVLAKHGVTPPPPPAGP